MVLRVSPIFHHLLGCAAGAEFAFNEPIRSSVFAAETLERGTMRGLLFGGRRWRLQELARRCIWWLIPTALACASCAGVSLRLSPLAHVLDGLEMPYG